MVEPMSAPQELVYTVDAANKAAAAGETSRACDSLKLLAKQSVTAQLLLQTGAGKKIKKLAKSEDAAVAAAAADVVEAWKTTVKKEQAGNDETLKRASSSGGNTMRAAAAAATEAATLRTVAEDSLTPPSAGVARSGAPLGVPPGTPTSPGGTRGAAWDAAAAVEQERVVRADPDAGQVAKDKAAARAAIKPTGVPARDKMRALLAEALAVALFEVPGGQPAGKAGEVETALFSWGGGVTARYKAKFRTLSFNLKDAANPDLRRRVLSGEITPADLMELGTEELASDARKADNQKIREHALWDAERGASKKATTDQFQCGKCRQRKCTYYQMQTRSADEPMTTFVSCLNCEHRWKFC